MSSVQALFGGIKEKGVIHTEGPDAIFAPLPPIDWTCEGMQLCPGRPFMLAGYGFSGKSLLGEELAIASALGDQAFGAFTIRQGRALYVDNEMGCRLNYGRLQRLARARGKWAEDFSDDLHVATYPDVRFDHKDAYDIFCRAFCAFSLVILDSFTTFVGGIDENASEAGGPLYMLGKVSEATGATIGVIHHARKPQKDAPGGLGMSIRGSGAIFGACDSIYVLGAQKGEPVRVEHVRSPTTGIMVDTFGLAIHDTDGGSGMRLEYLPPEQLSAQDEKRGSSILDRAMTSVLETVMRNPGVQSANRICELARGERKSKLAALKILEEEGRVKRRDRGFYAQ